MPLETVLLALHLAATAALIGLVWTVQLARTACAAVLVVRGAS